MKRIAVGVLSLGMLAATSAQGDHYDYYGQGTTMRPDDTRAYPRQRFEGKYERGTSGPYGTDTYREDYWAQGKMKPSGDHYDHQRFEGGFEDRTTGRKSYIGGRKNAYRGVGRSYERGTYRTNARGMKGDKRGWFNRKNAYDGPGMGGQADNY